MADKDPASRVDEYRVRHDVSILLLGILAVIGMGFVLWVTRPVLLPLVIAWFLFYMLAPIMRFIRRQRVSRGLAVVVIVLLLLGLCYLGGIFVFQRVNAFVEAYPKYQDKIFEIIDALNQRFEMPIGSLGEINWVTKAGPRLLDLSGSFVNFLGKAVLVIIFLVFLLLGEGQLQRKIGQAFPEARADRISAAITEIGDQIGRYMRTKVLVSAATGILVWLILLLLGVDFPVTWGVFAFLLNFIPNVGSILASIPPILIALLENYPSPWTAILTAAILLTLQVSIGNFVEPKLQGDSLNLSPVVILFFLVFWGWLWGIVGMLLSVPIAATIKIFCENVEPLKPISIFMGAAPKQRT